MNPLSPVPGTHVAAQTQIVWYWNKVLNATGYKWNITDDYSTATELGTDTSKTETGLICLTPYTRYVWTYSTCGVSSARMLSQITSGTTLSAPTSDTHVPSLTQIVWKWNSVVGATGYKWSTSNDFATAIDVGLSLLIVETGLTCNTLYTRYLWAYSDCGISTVTTLTQATSSTSITAPTAGTHVPSPTQIIWNWNVVSGATGYKWNTTNDYSTAIDMGTATSKTETGLICNTAYTRYIWAYSSCGASGAATLNQTTSSCTWTCGQSITDARDGKTYNTVLIGTQCWFKENLNVGIKIDVMQNQTNNEIKEKYCYDGLESNCDIYGGLYQWDELMNYTTSSNTNPSGRQGICPAGWHIPSDGECTQLTTFLEGEPVAGGKMKEEGTTHWASPNTGATNSSGFTALPGGYRRPIGDFLHISTDGFFWSSTESSITDSWDRGLYNFDAQVIRNIYEKTGGLSGRCLRD